MIRDTLPCLYHPAIVTSHCYLWNTNLSKKNRLLYPCFLFSFLFHGDGKAIGMPVQQKVPVYDTPKPSEDSLPPFYNRRCSASTSSGYQSQTNVISPTSTSGSPSVRSEPVPPVNLDHHPSANRSVVPRTPTTPLAPPATLMTQRSSTAPFCQKRTLGLGTCQASWTQRLCTVPSPSAGVPPCPLYHQQTGDTLRIVGTRLPLVRHLGAVSVGVAVVSVVMVVTCTNRWSTRH